MMSLCLPWGRLSRPRAPRCPPVGGARCLPAPPTRPPPPSGGPVTFPRLKSEVAGAGVSSGPAEGALVQETPQIGGEPLAVAQIVPGPPVNPPSECAKPVLAFLLAHDDLGKRLTIEARGVLDSAIELPEDAILLQAKSARATKLPPGSRISSWSVGVGILPMIIQ